MNSLTFGLMLKKKTGKKYVAIFGKTFVDENSGEYLRLESFAHELVNNGLGVVHGGYIGLMKAVSDGANAGILENNLDREMNIGVIEETLELNCVPKAACVHTVPANGIMERANSIINIGDFIVVAEHGAFGTLLEVVGVFHMNQLSKKFGGVIKPIIFVGGNWKKLYDDMISSLDMYNQDNGESFIYFVDEYGDALQLIREKN